MVCVYNMYTPIIDKISSLLETMDREGMSRLHVELTIITKRLGSNY